MKRLKRWIKNLFFNWFWARKLQIREAKGMNPLALYLDFKKMQWRYGITRTEYRENKLYLPSSPEQQEVIRILEERKDYIKEWKRDNYRTRRFLRKYMSFRYDTSERLTRKRVEAYTRHYGFGKDCQVQHGVNICRAHLLPGTITVGNNVFFAKNVFVDYSGHLTIENGVSLTAGVCIETHHRDLDAFNAGEHKEVPSDLIIRENAFIGTQAIILDSCHYIGKCSRIGAGAVVVNDIPDYSVAVGVPAKVVKEIEH